MKKFLIVAVMLATVSLQAAEAAKTDYRYVKKGKKLFAEITITYSDTWRRYRKASVDGKEVKTKLVDSEILFWSLSAREVVRVKITNTTKYVILTSDSGHVQTVLLSEIKIK